MKVIHPNSKPTASSTATSRVRGGLGKVLFGVLIGMALVLLAAQFSGGIPFLFTGDDRDGRTTSRMDTSQALRFPVEDKAYLNRIFRERTHEVAYCGYLLDLEGTWLEPWLADTINASPHSIRFSIENYRGGNARLGATIHTHPSGNPGLSERDRSTLAVQRQRLMCIQSGEISASLGETTIRLSCYRDSHLNGKTQVSEVPVIVGTQPALGETWE